MVLPGRRATSDSLVPQAQRARRVFRDLLDLVACRVFRDHRATPVLKVQPGRREYKDRRVLLGQQVQTVLSPVPLVHRVRLASLVRLELTALFRDQRDRRDRRVSRDRRETQVRKGRRVYRVPSVHRGQPVRQVQRASPVLRVQLVLPARMVRRGPRDQRV